MKSVVNKVEPKPETYPVIKIYNNCIVLFTSPSTGTCLAGAYSGVEGYYIEAWPEDLYTVFTGSVTLSND